MGCHVNSDGWMGNIVCVLLVIIAVICGSAMLYPNFAAPCKDYEWRTSYVSDQMRFVRAGPRTYKVCVRR